MQTRRVSIQESADISYVHTAAYNPLWWQKQGLMYTASGYGRKIPTSWTVRYNGKVRRIYCCIYSNIGTCYIIVNGAWRIVDDAY
jgi:hypothetical protein